MAMPVTVSQCRVVAVVLVATMIGVSGGRAADWVERPYDPPAGSRWIIQRDLSSERNDNGTVTKDTFKITSELKIVGKEGAQFKIIYARRQFSYQSDDAEEQTAMLATLPVLQNIEYHVIADAGGKPLRVENLAEAKAALRAAFAATAKSMSGDPQVADSMRRTLAPMLDTDEKSAAELYLDELPTLATAQNTSLKPGETRRETVAEPSPIGQFTTNRTLTISEADPATGKAVVVLTESWDPKTTRALMDQVLERAGLGDDERKKKVETLEVSLEKRTTFDVAEGMTRKAIVESTTRSNLWGPLRVVKSRKVVTVTEAR
jgi:hypothetical protein